MSADLELQERLGQGSMTEVWKAFDPQLQRNVAVKIFLDDLVNKPNFMTSYRNLPRVREAKQILSLRHPNIVRMRGFHLSPPSESEKTQAYIVMDYIEGPTLADYLRDTSYRKVFPSAREMEDLFAAIAAAVDYAHEQGVIHGDLKPSNILLDIHNSSRYPMGEPMLTDFGLRILLETSTGALDSRKRDIPFYISPEQVRGHPANKHSDLYALGVMLYEICTGMRPFQSERSALIRETYVNTMPPSPDQVNPHISADLSAIILRSLAKDPLQRFSSAASMITALSEALSQPVSLAGTTNGRIHLLSTEPTLLPGLVSSVPSPHVIAQPLPQPQTEQDTTTTKLPRPPAAIRTSSLPKGRGQDAPASSSGISGEERMLSEQDTTTTKLPRPPAAIRTSIPPKDRRQDVPPSSPHHKPGSPSPFVPERKPRRSLSKGGRIALIAILLLLLAAGTLSTLVLLPHKYASPATPAATTLPIVGHVYFLSSGQLYVNNNQGIYDQVLIDLHNIAVLLIDFSRLLITQENSSAPSVNPFLDPQTWRYYGQIYQLPSPKDVNHFSMLDHLRHLLVQAPELKVLGLPGGLSVWLLRNVEEILRWSVEAKDRFANTAAVRGLLSNILYYLDGECTPADLQGVPPDTPTTPGNATIAQISRFSLINPCLQEQQEQADILKQVFHATPHDYVDHTLFHLTGVVQSPGATHDLSVLATQLNRAVSDLKSVLERIRQDALHLVHLTDAQLQQPAAFTLVGDMVLQARYAYAGQTDLVTGTSQEGVLWIYNNIQRLATFDVTPYSSR